MHLLWLGRSIMALSPPSSAHADGCYSAPQGFHLLLQPWQRLCQPRFQQLRAAVPARSTALAARNAPAPAQRRPFSSHTTPAPFRKPQESSHRSTSSSQPSSKQFVLFSKILVCLAVVKCKGKSSTVKIPGSQMLLTVFSQ